MSATIFSLERLIRGDSRRIFEASEKISSNSGVVLFGWLGLLGESVKHMSQSVLNILKNKKGWGMSKVFAYYLPQFYETDENNKWHGKGFTEWTKTTASRPLFYGHRQPRTPSDAIGHYTFSRKVLERQSELAETYGVDGFIFYHYDFDGHKLLDKPAKIWLENKHIGLPIAFCWANENWTRTWSGGNNEILVEQRYSDGFAERFLTEIKPFMMDERYIRINGEPMLMIYRPHLIPNANSFIDELRELGLKMGLGRLNLIGVDTTPYSGENLLARFPRIDSWMQRPMYNWTRLRASLHEVTLKNSEKFMGTVFRYDDVAEFYASEKLPGFMHSGCTVDWDTSPRHGNKSLILQDTTSESFEHWLRCALEREKEVFPNEEEQMVLVTAWNEWAEGAYLEPDLVNGYLFLEAIAKAKE